MGFLDDEGYVHFAGRIKELIIRGGENIIPNELAAAISEHESIADVKVVGVPDEVLGEAVAAAVILKDGYVFDEACMREFLSTRLARFKIPAYFFVYEKFPALANGKIDTVSLTKELAEKVKGMN